jgi:hypothetical protein
MPDSQADHQESSKYVHLKEVEGSFSNSDVSSL